MTTPPKEITINNARYVLIEETKKPTFIEIKSRLEIYPTNLPVMTYLDAVKAVAKMGGDWRIPTIEELRLMYKNKDSIGGFITESSGSGYPDYPDFPDWYWSCTEDRDDPSGVWYVRLSDGLEDWLRKDGLRLSCRPIRSVSCEK